MSHTQNTILDIIRFAKNSQVQSQLRITQQDVFKGGALSPQYSRTLYLTRTALEFMNNSYPANSTLRQVGEFTFALCRGIGVLVPTPTISISNPANASVNVGDTATFCVTVSVSTGAPYTIQWFRNGVLIPGATSLCYSLVNAQLSDSGSTFNAVATSVGVGVAVSATATITVTSALIGDFAYMDADPGAQLQAGLDPFTYQVQFPIVSGADFTISAVGTPIPFASSPNKFLIVRVPSTEPAKGNWFNDNFNNGIFPDFNWQTPVTFGGKTYYYSRQGLSLNTNNTLILST